MSEPSSYYAVVCEVIVNVLCIEPDEIRPDARWIDLEGGDDSINLLEFSFQIEKRLGVRLKFNELFGREFAKADAQGVILPESLAALKAAYPFLPMHTLPAEPKGSDLIRLLTVQSLTDFVAFAVGQKQAASSPLPA